MKTLTALQIKFITEYLGDNPAELADEFLWIDNDKIHPSVFLPKSFTRLEDEIFILGSIEAANKLLYYVGAERFAVLEAYNSRAGIAIFSNIEERFDDKLSEKPVIFE
jgi:hypothetical protein